MQKEEDLAANIEEVCTWAVAEAAVVVATAIAEAEEEATAERMIQANQEASTLAAAGTGKVRNFSFAIVKFMKN